MKGKKLAVRGIALLCSLWMFSTSIPVYADGDNDDILDERVEHTELSFDELQYEQMSEADFDAIVADLSTLVTDEANKDRVTEIIIAMEDYYNELNANYTIANIYSTLEANNTEYDDWVTYCDELGTSVGDKIYINYNLIATSACSSALEERIDDEEEWQEILDYVPLTQEQKDLAARETELSLEYDELYIAEYTTEIDGVAYTEEELEEAVDAGTIDYTQFYDGIADIYTQRNQVLGELFLELLEVRTQIAASHGYDNYADYAYEEIYGRDYSPEDLEAYREQIKEYYGPLLNEIYDLYGTEYYDEVTAMWDYEVSEEECLEALESHLSDISEDLVVSYQYMIDHEMYDIGVDEEKAPGGYTTSISGEYNAPYMFNCADGSYSDLGTLIHEFGHYNQMYYASEEEWYYNSYNLDLAEIHSQGLEVIYLEYADDLYGEYADPMVVYTMLNHVYSTVEGAKEDAFQYAVYSEAEGMTLDRLNEIYYEVCVEYSDQDLYYTYLLGTYGFGDLKEGQILEWVEIPHTFQSPLYYISYSVSMAAVEELRDELEADREAGIELYLELVQRGCDGDYQEVIEEAGLNNPITNPRFDEYADNIRVELGLAETDDTATDEPEETEEPEESEEPEEDEDDEEDEEEEERESGRTSGRSSGNSAGKSVIVTVLIVLAVILVIVLVVIIAILISNRKKKEKPQGMPGQMMPPYQQGMPGQPMPPYQQGMPGQMMPPYQQGVPGQPMPPYQQGVPGQMMPPYQQGVPGQPMPPYQQGVPGQMMPPYQQGIPGQPMPSYQQENSEQPKADADKQN